MTNLNVVDRSPDGRRQSALDLMGRYVLNAVRDAHSDGVSTYDIARALITIGRALLAAAAHKPPVH
jgi:hypothetical protein